MIIPDRLHAGDCLGVFSPSGPVRDREKVDAGIHLLQKMGFRIKLGLFAGPDEGYLAAGDRKRIEEFHGMLLDDEVSALMALRGGYGCLRIAGRLDYGIIRSCRKMIIGFSDVSILLNTVSGRTGMVTVHGPVLTSLAHTDSRSLDALKSLLVNGLPSSLAPEETVVLRPGDSRGVLRGGNLATLVHLLGTPWEIPWKGTLLLLEDTGEPMYRIDRMLTQLHYSGSLDHLAGIILGGFDLGADPVENAKLQEQVWERVLELTADRDYPVWGNFPVGHREKNIAVPLGLAMRMESGPKMISVVK